MKRIRVIDQLRKKYGGTWKYVYEDFTKKWIGLVPTQSEILLFEDDSCKMKQMDVRSYSALCHAYDGDESWRVIYRTTDDESVYIDDWRIYY